MKTCAECGKPLDTEPRYETVVDPSAPSWFPEIKASAARFGIEMMPWQEKAARLVSQTNPAGLPARITSIVSTPRQSGKTRFTQTLLDAAARMTPNGRLYGTNTSAKEAVRHLEELGLTLQTFDSTVQMRMANGSERIKWPNGASYEVIPPNEKGGHGLTIRPLFVGDEAWTLTDQVLGSGIRPGMVASEKAFLVLVSTMGVMSSTTWNRLVASGRESIEDPASETGYIEYSAEKEEDLWDEDKWHEFQPALGRTISHRAIRAAIADTHPNEAVRAYSNITTAALHSVFPAEWVTKAWAVIQPPARFVCAVEVNDSPPGGSVATAHPVESGTAVRVIENRTGSAHWIPTYVKTLLDARQVEAVVVDFGGPAKVIETELRLVCDNAYVPLIDRRGDAAADCANFFAALRDGTVVLQKTETLEIAIAGAHKKPWKDLWFISRAKMLVDSSPLIAAILGYGTAVQLGITPRVVPSIY